jgi:hypothetical protein
MYNDYQHRGYSGLLAFGTLSIIRYYKEHNFLETICFIPHKRLSPSPEDGNRYSFRNVVIFAVLQNTRQ